MNYDQLMGKEGDVFHLAVDFKQVVDPNIPVNPEVVSLIESTDPTPMTPDSMENPGEILPPTDDQIYSMTPEGDFGSFHWQHSGDTTLMALSDSVMLDTGGAPILEALDRFGYNRLYDWSTIETPGTWYYHSDDGSFTFIPSTDDVASHELGMS